MKVLQNNFTTPEQSKRLLEFGVPADSADCYWYNYDLERQNREYRRPHVRNNHTYRFKDFFGCYGTEYIPCWSVGQLMKIFIICTPYVEITLRTRFIEQLIASYEDVIKHGLIDFSKLEE